MPRFYCPPPLLPGATLALPDEVARHLHVLRLAPGALLTLFDGSGGEVVARLDELGKRAASATVLEHLARECELPFAVHLAQGLPEGGKMDWIVEKAVECGAAALTPVAAQRSVTRLSDERAEKKRAHWEGIVRAASEQCGRNRLMAVAAPCTLAELLARRDLPGARLLLSPRGTLTLAAWARAAGPQPVALLIGPEGGYSPQEEEACLAAGAIAVTLGPRVLRTETAAPAVLAMLAALWE
ncbi:MAG: 16S rRNA (uracil(1498)-N(3))-methyltransferase [Telluria sp.]